MARAAHLREGHEVTCHRLQDSLDGIPQVNCSIVGTNSYHSLQACHPSLHCVISLPSFLINQVENACGHVPPLAPFPRQSAHESILAVVFVGCVTPKESPPLHPCCCWVSGQRRECWSQPRVTKSSCGDVLVLRGFQPPMSPPHAISFAAQTCNLNMHTFFDLGSKRAQI